MSFYEDLGLRQGATTEEVREQYRVLVRLLHPDQFADPVLKAAAEGQLRRFNEIEAVLTNPERRRDYESGLLESSTTIIVQAPQPQPQRKIPWNSIAWGAAAMACSAAIVWVSGHDTPAAPAPVEVRSANSHQGEDWRARTRTALVERDRALRELAKLKGQAAARFAGKWLNARPVSVTDKPIETQITESNGQVQGRYMSPSVNFDFAGTAAGTSAQMPFVRDDGARGEVRLRLISEHEMELAWTAGGDTPTFASGTAVLVKSQ